MPVRFRTKGKPIKDGVVGDAHSYVALVRESLVRLGEEHRVGSAPVDVAIALSSSESRGMILSIARLLRDEGAARDAGCQRVGRVMAISSEAAACAAFGVSTGIAVDLGAETMSALAILNKRPAASRW